MQVVNLGGHARKTRREGRGTMGSKEAKQSKSMSGFLMWETRAPSPWGGTSVEP